MNSTPGSVLLKLSGEALSGGLDSGVDPATMAFVTGEILALTTTGVRVAMVVGGGNFFRGMQAPWMDRVTADHTGMLATVMNGLLVRSALADAGIETRMMSALAVEGVASAYNVELARRLLSQNTVLILCGGTGNPMFTTDTAAALRAVELDAELLIKATRVDGVYSADPEKDPSAERYVQLSFDDVLKRRLAVMDQAAFALCRDHQIPIRVLDLFVTENLAKAARGEQVGTLVC